MHGMRIGLQDTEGIFLDLVPEEPEKTPSDEQHGELLGVEEEPTLKVVSEEKDTLQAEVRSMKEAIPSQWGVREM